MCYDYVANWPQSWIWWTISRESHKKSLSRNSRPTTGLPCSLWCCLKRQASGGSHLIHIPGPFAAGRSRWRQVVTSALEADRIACLGLASHCRPPISRTGCWSGWSGRHLLWPPGRGDLEGWGCQQIMLFDGGDERVRAPFAGGIAKLPENQSCQVCLRKCSPVRSTHS